MGTSSEMFMCENIHVLTSPITILSIRLMLSTTILQRDVFSATISLISDSCPKALCRVTSEAYNLPLFTMTCLLMSHILTNIHT